MKTNDYCSQCGHKETCSEVYGKLGRYEGPSVVWEVIAAFVIPIAVFIASTAACQWLLRDNVGEKALTAAGFSAGISFTLLYIFGMRRLRTRIRKRHCDSR